MYPVTRLQRKITRSKRGLSLLSLLLTLCIGGISSSHAEKIALLVGISDYMDRPLEGPQHDVQALKQVLVEKWGFHDSNIKTLLNAEATHRNILNELNSLQGRSKAGDHIVIYLSGHGTSALDSDFGLPLPYNSGAFIPYDFDPVKIKKITSDEQLNQILIIGSTHLRPVLQALDRDRDVTIIVDSCYSGNATRNFRQEAGRLVSKTRNYPLNLPVNLIPKTSSLIPKEEKYPYQRVVSLTASSESEPANDIDSSMLAQNPSLSFDQKPHGLFSSVLLQILNEPDSAGQASLTYGKLLQDIHNRISSYRQVPTQTPQLQPYLQDDTNNLASRSLFGIAPASEPQSASPAISDSDSRAKYPALTVALLPETLNLKPHLEQLGVVVVEDKAPADMVLSLPAAEQWTLSNGNGDLILSKSSLRQVLRRVEAEAWLNQLSQARTQSKAFSANLLQFSTQPASKGNGFNEGELFQLSAKASQDLYFTIFSIDIFGNVHLLYPLNQSENISHPANQILTLPANDHFKVVAPFGIDTLVAATTSSKLSGLSSMQALFSEQGAPVSHAASQALRQALQEANARFNVIKIRTYPKP